MSKSARSGDSGLAGAGNRTGDQPNAWAAVQPESQVGTLGAKAPRYPTGVKKPSVGAEPTPTSALVRRARVEAQHAAHRGRLDREVRRLARDRRDRRRRRLLHVVVGRPRRRRACWPRCRRSGRRGVRVEEHAVGDLRQVARGLGLVEGGRVRRRVDGRVDVEGRGPGRGPRERAVEAVAGAAVAVDVVEATRARSPMSMKMQLRYCTRALSRHAVAWSPSDAAGRSR